MSSTSKSAPRLLGPLLATAFCDLIAVAVFVAIGRRSHDESESIAGFANSLWPFLLGAAVGWAVAFAATRSDLFQPSALVPAGIIIWVSTVAIGMLARVVSGQGTAVSFIIVASIATGVLLLGWRGLAAFAASRRA